MYRGLGHCHFVEILGTSEPELQVETAFEKEVGLRHPHPKGGIRGGQCCTCWKCECLYPANTLEGGKNGTWTNNKGSPYLFQQCKCQALISFGIQSLRYVEPQTTRIAALLSAAPGHGQQPTSAGEGPTAPSLISQLPSLQVNLPMLLSKQGLSGILRIGLCKTSACSLIFITLPYTDTLTT